MRRPDSEQSPMKRPPFKRIVLSCCLLVLAFLVGRWITEPTDTWRVVDTGRFSFMYPPDMGVNPVAGMDSLEVEFQNKTMVVELEYGMFANDLKGMNKTVTFREEKAKSEEEAGAFRPGYHYSAEVSVHELNLSIDYKRPGDYATARKIIESVRLRPNRAFDMSRFPPVPSWWQRWLWRLRRLFR